MQVKIVVNVYSVIRCKSAIKCSQHCIMLILYGHRNCQLHRCFFETIKAFRHITLIYKLSTLHIRKSKGLLIVLVLTSHKKGPLVWSYSNSNAINTCNLFCFDQSFEVFNELIYRHTTYITITLLTNGQCV